MTPQQPQPLSGQRRWRCKGQHPSSPAPASSPAAMGDPSVLVTEESRDASQEAKGMAMEAMSQASVFIKMKEPAVAIRDAKDAPEVMIDPDSAKGTRLMGWHIISFRTMLYMAPKHMGMAHYFSLEKEHGTLFSVPYF